MFAGVGPEEHSKAIFQPRQTEERGGRFGSCGYRAETREEKERSSAREEKHCDGESFEADKTRREEEDRLPVTTLIRFNYLSLVIIFDGF